jgi:DNA-binding NarL/FixJ family response regulator
MPESIPELSFQVHTTNIPAWLRAALARTAQLTPRQLSALRYLGEGLSNAGIARALACSERTVKLHTTEVVRRLELESRTQAALVGYHMTLNGTPGMPGRSMPEKTSTRT